MSGSTIDPDVQKNLTRIRSKHGDKVAVSEIADVVESMMATLQGDVDASDFQLFHELEALASYIHSVKLDVAALRPDEVKDEHLPKASDELDAIVDATADATNRIMDATEQVERVMEEVDSQLADRLMNATTNIYEACSFQDITGQRISKVVGALKEIEEKIDGLVQAFGSEIERVKAEQPKKEKEADAPLSDEELLQGPQLEGKGNTQDEIDALLASFD